MVNWPLRWELREIMGDCEVDDKVERAHRCLEIIKISMSVLSEQLHQETTENRHTSRSRHCGEAAPGPIPPFGLARPCSDFTVAELIVKRT